MSSVSHRFSATKTSRGNGVAQVPHSRLRLWPIPTPRMQTVRIPTRRTPTATRQTRRIPTRRTPTAIPPTARRGEGLEQPALLRCVGDVDAFLTTRWGRAPYLLSNAEGSRWADLASLADYDRIITSMALRSPFFRVVKDGKEIPASSYTRALTHRSQRVSGLIDPTSIIDLYRQGASIVLESLHRYWKPVMRFCQQLEADLGHPVQANAYLTPAGAQGFARHSDSHDVFVLQTDGRKRWIVFVPDDSAELAGSASIEAELSEGDCLYIPEGWPHAASTNDVPSAHLTVGILTRNRSVLVDEIISLAQRDNRGSERLPVRPHDDEVRLGAMIDEEIENLKLSLDKLDRDELLHRSLRRLTTTSLEVTSGQLLQSSHLAQLDDGTRVRVREGAVFRVWPEGTDVKLLLADRELRLPGFTEPALRAIKGSGDLKVVELAHHLDEASRLVLVKRLIEEGLLEVCT
jgi:bifunctional lysine-specific demethylase and histidyl-hydroxylase NO66